VRAESEERGKAAFDKFKQMIDVFMDALPTLAKYNASAS